MFEEDKTIMQKYLLYRKGLQMADIDQDDVKSGAQRALSDWIVRERLLLDETEGRQALTYDFQQVPTLKLLRFEKARFLVATYLF
jgi:hypothetical protein